MTAIHDSHPSRDQLAALSEGRLTGEDVLAVECHVTTCEVCADTLGELGAGDQLLARLRSAVVDDPDKTGMISINQQAEEAILKFLEPSTRAGSLGRLGHYEVLEGLGRGAFGIVLKAFDDSLQRVVAVKVLAPEIAATSPARKRFLREARTAAQVRHQNVVQIYAVEEQPLPYLVMEYIPGETLQQRLNQCGPLEVSEVLRLGHEIARGLAAAHAQGLIHRDIKPGNILLEKGLEERVKLTDFGLARAVDDASLTQSGIIAGTPMFMAPEQARGETTDQRADLFSLGSVLYTMVSGRPPFRASGTVAVLKRVCDDTPRPIQEIIPETPQWLCDIISKLHAKRPEDRFASAREVADLLGHCLTELKQEKVPSVPSLGTGEEKPLGSSRTRESSVRSLTTSATGDRLQQEKVPSAPNLAPPATPPAAPASESAVKTPPLASRQTSEVLKTSEVARIRNHRLVIAAAALLVLLSGLTLTEATGVTKFAATIIRIATGEGQIVIETDGAGVEVVIKDQQGTVLVDGATKREITFKAGEYNIEVTVTDAGGEQRFVTDQFTLTRNGKKIVDARWELAKSKPKAELHDADRRVAEWLLSIGGNVRILVDGNEQPLKIGEPLPQGAFQVVEVVLSYLPGMKNEHLSRLIGLKNLRDLYIDDSGLTDAGMEHIKSLTSLTSLGFPNTAVTDAGMAHVKNLTNIESLTATGSQITDLGLEHLAALPNLKVLSLASTDVTDTGLKRIKRLTSLQSLSLERTQVTDAGMEQLQSHTNLVNLVLAGTSISDAGLKSLTVLKMLTDLHLGDTRVTDAGLEYLKVLTRLENLQLKGTAVTDAGLVHLKALPNPEVVNLQGTRLTDVGLAHLHELNKLREVDLRATDVTAAGTAALRKARPQCKIISDHGTFEPTAPIDPDRRAAEWVLSVGGAVNVGSLNANEQLWLDPTKNLPAAPFLIVQISLRNNERVTESGLMHLNGLSKLSWLDLVNSRISDAGLMQMENLPSLTTLLLEGNSQVSDAGLENLKGATQLKLLGLQGTRVTDAGLQHLKHLSNLELLYLDYTNVSDAGIVHLKRLSKLDTLLLANTQVGDAILEHLNAVRTLRALDLTGTKVKYLTHLRTLNDLQHLVLRSTTLSGAALEELSQIKSLVHVDLKGSNVAAAGVKKLVAALPQCKIFSDHGTFEPTAPADPDRRAAAWVLAIDGTIKIILKETDEEREIKAGGELPPGALELKFVNLNDNKRVTDAGLARFKDCKNLTQLHLSATQVSDAGLAHFKDCKNLTHLSLYLTQVGDAGLAHFKDCKSLTWLHLGGTQVSDMGLDQLKDCKELAHVDLAGTQVSDMGLAHLKDCKKLAHVDLAGTKVRDAGLAHLKDYKSLTWLHLGSTQVSDMGLAQFKDCKNLRGLNLDGTQVTDAGLEHLKDCKNLTNLHLWNTQVSDAGLEHVAGLPKLVYVILRNTKFTEASVKKLSAALPGCKIEWDGGVIEPMVASTDPDRRAAEWVLSIGSNVSIKENGQEREIKAVGDLPRGAFELSSVDLHGTPKVTDAELARFQDCKNIKSLRLGGAQITDAGLVHFQNCKNVTQLNIRQSNRVTDAGLAHFKDCKNLTSLSLTVISISDAGLAHFQDCKNLMHLLLPITGVSDAGLAHFQDCKNLTTINLDETKVSDAGLVHFQDCKKLVSLRLQRTQVSDGALADLASLTSLESLLLNNTRISLRGHEQLKAAMPKCQITWSEANRTVAESALALGGSVEIGPRDKPESRPVEAATDLPDDYFQVRRVSLAGVTKPLDKLPLQLSWLRFPEFDRLESLDLSGIIGLNYDFLASIHGLQELALAKAGLDDSRLAKLPKLPALKRLVLDDNDIRGPGLTSLEKQSTLTELSLANAGLKDESLANLPKLPALKRLVLDGNEIRGTGLTHLSGQPELIDLSLNCPTLTDLTAKNLAELKQLERLSLADSGLSDAGIKHLAGLTNLESLDLHRTKATAAGVAELHEALPQCKILSDHGTFEPTAAAR